MVSVNKDPIFPSVSVCVLPRAMRHTEAPLACFSQTQVHCCCAQPTIQSVCFQCIPSTLVLRSKPTPASDAWYKSSKTFWLEGSKLSKPALTSAKTPESGRSTNVCNGDIPPNSANDVVGEGLVWHLPYLSISPMQLLKHLKFPHCTG